MVFHVFGSELAIGALGGSVRLGMVRRPKNLIMGVCLRRTLVARIFAVVMCCDLWCCDVK
jgi:hypothetical protein